LKEWPKRQLDNILEYATIKRLFRMYLMKNGNIGHLHDAIRRRIMWMGLQPFWSVF
jgi:hypothetical protein